MGRGKVVAMAAGTVLLLLGSGAAEGEVAAGRQLYLRYCSACHGSDGKGDGVVSGFLRPKPADLTLLARSHDGVFPTLTVVEVIDGRATPRAHGDPDMPVGYHLEDAGSRREQSRAGRAFGGHADHRLPAQYPGQVTRHAALTTGRARARLAALSLSSPGAFRPAQPALR